jgi:uncharacterized protein (DUF1697 family)
MARYAAFLRAINVSDRKATGAQLRAGAEREGFEEVASFRNSGNLVVSATGMRAGEVARRLERGLEAELGFEVPVFARSARQIAAIAGYKPFPSARTKASKGKLQVLLLERRPAAAAGKKALQLATEDDLLKLRGTELYWLPSGGTQDSGLDQKALGQILGRWTARTMGTIEQMAAKYFAG